MRVFLTICLFSTFGTTVRGQEAPAGPLLKSDAAYARMTGAEARETEAYTLGVQAVVLRRSREVSKVCSP